MLVRHVLVFASLFSLLDSRGKSSRRFENIPPAGLGITPCKDHMRCTAFINNSACVRGICACTENFVLHPTNSRLCLPVIVDRRSACEEHVQCTETFGQHAECSGRCICRLGHHFVSNSCLPSRGLGAACSQTTDCYLPMDGFRQKTVCHHSSHVCICREGFSPGAGGQSCTNTGASLKEACKKYIVAVVLMLSVMQ